MSQTLEKSNLTMEDGPVLSFPSQALETPQETRAFEKLNDAFKRTSDAVARIQTAITKLEANRQSTLQIICAVFIELHRDLNRRMSVLTKQTNEVAQEKKRKFNEHLENLTKYRTSLQEVCSIDNTNSVIFREHKVLAILH